MQDTDTVPHLSSHYFTPLCPGTKQWSIRQRLATESVSERNDVLFVDHRVSGLELESFRLPPRRMLTQHSLRPLVD